MALWKDVKTKSRQHSMRIAVLFAICTLIMQWEAALHYKLNVVIEHNVAVYEQLDNGDWRMSSDEDPSLVFRPCPEDALSGVDVNEMLRQGVGYIADYAEWEERGKCKSILHQDWGFWFKDKHNNFTYQKIKER